MIVEDFVRDADWHKRYAADVRRAGYVDLWNREKNSAENRR